LVIIAILYRTFDSDSDLNSTRVGECEKARSKAAAARDREVEHAGETVLRTTEALVVVLAALDAATMAGSAAARSGHPSPISDDW
jgi:hypothetical protein